tara:strand:- start:102 stop:332 length:231 start_codon:yes stop_codon:yes gene_type:complete
MKVFTTRGVRVRERKKEREFFLFFCGVSPFPKVSNMSFGRLVFETLFFLPPTIYAKYTKTLSFLLFRKEREIPYFF